jgi:wyosine [tRNA(Phe)-imidazoG37] synthetase (radical SAM superfamily)
LSGPLPRRLDFQDHRRDLDRNVYVYAVVSRRARGLSVGVNLNPDKVCNFDCPYCQVDRTTPGGPSKIDVPALAAELDAVLDRVQAGTLWQTPPFDTAAEPLRRLADIAFAGDGEPTTPVEFPEAARAARTARDRHGLAIPLRLITNATMLDRERVRRALPDFDELWCKLDAGTEAYFRLVDGTRFPFAKVLDNLLSVAKERPIVVQSLFLAWDGRGPDDAEIEAYVGRLSHIVAEGGRIDDVQVYTVARRPADARVGALDLAALEQIAERVRAVGLRASIYGPS